MCVCVCVCVRACALPAIMCGVGMCGIHLCRNGTLYCSVAFVCLTVMAKSLSHLYVCGKPVLIY